MIEDASDFVLPSFEEDRSGGARIVLAMIGSEVFATATPAQADNFFVAIGRRMAALVPVGDVEGLDELESRINRLWRALHWGRAHLRAVSDGIAILHEGVPPGLENDFDGRWPAMVEAVLRGAYDGWFRALGSDAALRTSLVRRLDSGLELRHGL